MAEFSTNGRTGFFGNTYDAPAINSFSFFAHSFLYALDTGTYSDTLVRGQVESGSSLSFDRDWVELTGTELTVQTSDGFALTGGFVTGYHNSSYEIHGYLITLIDSRDFITAGFSIPSTVFWNLASSNQWHDIWLLATAGNDTMTGSDVEWRADLIEGGAGNDTIFAQAGGDALWGNGGSDYLSGGDGDDWVIANDWETGCASDLWDEAHGDAGNDYMFTGDYGHGYLVGGDGTDRIWGGSDVDFINGGAGIDYLAGGGALDVFEETAADVVAGEYDFILDFQDGVDFIKLPVGAAWAIADSAYGAVVSAPGTGFYLIVQYATAAMVSDQIYYA